MNQILISSKVYVTKELKRKQRIYQTIFLISILVIVSLLVYYFIAEKQKKKTPNYDFNLMISDFTEIMKKWMN